MEQNLNPCEIAWPGPPEPCPPPTLQSLKGSHSHGCLFDRAAAGGLAQVQCLQLSNHLDRHFAYKETVNVE